MVAACGSVRSASVHYAAVGAWRGTDREVGAHENCTNPGERVQAQEFPHGGARLLPARLVAWWREVAAGASPHARGRTANLERGVMSDVLPTSTISSAFPVSCFPSAKAII